MLRELQPLTPEPGTRRRRWFFCQEMDLVVWFESGDEPVAFQLAYDKLGVERSIEWDRGCGFRHHLVDHSKAGPRRWAASPLLLPDGPFDRDRVLRDFLALAAEIPPPLVAFVQSTLCGATADDSGPTAP
jgi:hypothetical protein